MRRMRLIVALCGVLGFLAAGLTRFLGESGIWAALSLPLTALGGGLRALSLSGFWGNLIAWAVVLCLCALPVLAVWRQKKEKRGLEDCLLLLEVPVIYGAAFYLTNPTYLGEPAAWIFPPAVLWTVLSLWLSWLVLKGLRRLNGMETGRLAAALQGLLAVCAGAWAFGVGLNAVGGLWTQMDQVIQGNTGDVSLTFLTLLLLHSLEAGIGLQVSFTILWGRELVRQLGNSAFSADTVALCGRTARACLWVIRATVLLSAAANLIQLLLLRKLYTTSFSVALPLVALALASGLFLLCRCLQQGHTLQMDNDSII